MTERLTLNPQNPWPGLAAFGEDDQAYFHGRERESDELARLVRRERLTVLFGRSGLGKSSLLSAGLFPRLREDLHLPVYLRIGYAAAASPRQQVWDALDEACAAGRVQAMPPDPDESLWAYFHRAGAGFWNPRRRPLLPVLVFDQFEEIFTLGQAGDAQRAAAQAFVEELADLIEDRPSEALQRQLDAEPASSEHIDFERRGCKVLLSFREDFLAEVEGLRDRMPSLMRNRFRLLPMDGAQALAVIGSGGALVDAGIAERIIGLAWRNRAEAPTPEEADRIEIDPALLSVICSELNLRRLAIGAPAIEADLLAGAEREILVDFYERSLQGLDPRVRKFVEDELITTAGYRDSCAYDDALARPGVTSEELERLVAGRLLGLDERFGVRRLELTHDVLTRVVMDSRDQRREREAREQAQHEARETQRRLRRSRRIAIAMTVLAIVLIGLLAFVSEGLYWATTHKYPLQALMVRWKHEAGVGEPIPMPDLVKVPAGSFQMGGSAKDENPVHLVTIAKPFYLAKTETTFEQYDAYCDATGCTRPSDQEWGRGKQPVINVDWNDAQEYAKWLSLMTGKACRLPSEAEWEYAARAGTTTAYPWGDEPGSGKANFAGSGSEWSGKQSAPVGRFDANDFDLYDMNGNVFEWVEDCWHSTYDGAPKDGVAWLEQGGGQCDRRVLRGGSWHVSADSARSAFRNSYGPALLRDHLGFRLLCSSPIE